MMFNSKIFNRRVFEWSRWHARLKRLLIFLGFDFYLKMDDRRVLETIILPYFQQQRNVNDVLFVGCDWYTRGYRKFFRKKNYWTMDINPVQKKFGSTQHIVDGCEHVGNYFDPGSLDLIFCNGVYGFGLNEPREFEEAIQGFTVSLREGGVFVLGWDDNPRRTPFPLSESMALSLLDRYTFPPLGTDSYLTANAGRHTYDFYTRKKNRQTIEP